MPIYVKLREQKALAERAALWFHQKWSVPLEAYQESIADCLAAAQPVPQWYLALEGDRIVGGLGIIENDFHERRELAPNVCAVFVEPDCRCRGIAGALLRLVCEDMAGQGISTLYLCTDHSSFYERYGWQYYGDTRNDDGSTSRVYIHRQLSQASE